MIGSEGRRNGEREGGKVRGREGSRKSEGEGGKERK